MEVEATSVLLFSTIWSGLFFQSTHQVISAHSFLPLHRMTLTRARWCLMPSSGEVLLFVRRKVIRKYFGAAFLHALTILLRKLCLLHHKWKSTTEVDSLSNCRGWLQDRIELKGLWLRGPAMPRICSLSHSGDHWQHSFRISGFDCCQDNASPISFYRTMTREGYKTLGCVVGCGMSSFTLSFSLNLIYCVNGSTSSHLTRILGKC